MTKFHVSQYAYMSRIIEADTPEDAARIAFRSQVDIEAKVDNQPVQIDLSSTMGVDVREYVEGEEDPENLGCLDIPESETIYDYQV
jgi:hypothetical protein